MEKDRETVGSLALERERKPVIVIEATQEAEVRKLRVAAYARVSSDSEDQLNSFGAQQRYYMTKISANDKWSLADIYADEGITGTSVEKRDDFKRLLADCRRGLVDKVLCKSISRFARNTRECLEAIRELKGLGVGIYFEEQNIDTATMGGELMTALFATLAQGESESISKNISWSIQKRMKKGTFVPSTLAYGYYKSEGAIVIDLPRAQVVCQIFSSYLDGANTGEIARRLNAEHIGNPDSTRVWTYRAVARILQNEKYLGDSLFQKSYHTDTLPRKERDNHGERERYYVTNTHPAIIDRTVFEQAQRLLKFRKEKFRREMDDASEFLVYKITCGQCGGAIRTKIVGGRKYYACRNHDTDYASCPVTQIPEKQICEAFLRMYHRLKRHGSPILNGLLQTLQKIREKRMLWSQDIVALNNEIGTINNQSRKLNGLKLVGLSDPDYFIRRSNELSGQLRAAKLAKERLLDAVSDETIPKTRELIELLEDAPEYMDTLEEEWFTALVEKITVESNDSLRFRLINGLELTERIERTVR